MDYAKNQLSASSVAQDLSPLASALQRLETMSIEAGELSNRLDSIVGRLIGDGLPPQQVQAGSPSPSALSAFDQLHLLATGLNMRISDIRVLITKLEIATAR